MIPKIRFAQEGDISSILEIINYEIVNSTAIYNYRERTLDEQKEWFYDKKKANMPIIVAEQEGEILGFGSYGIYRPREAYKYSVEHSIYVSKKARSQGIGKLLMNEIIRIAISEGYHTMVAVIDGANKESCVFHEKFGFVRTGVLKEIGYKFDKWLDVVFMQLMLNK